jgi:hypothetical protein
MQVNEKAKESLALSDGRLLFPCELGKESLEGRIWSERWVLARHHVVDGGQCRELGGNAFEESR